MEFGAYVFAHKSIENRINKKKKKAQAYNRADEKQISLTPIEMTLEILVNWLMVTIWSKSLAILHSAFDSI